MRHGQRNERVARRPSESGSENLPLPLREGVKGGGRRASDQRVENALARGAGRRKGRRIVGRPVRANLYMEQRWSDVRQAAGSGIRGGKQLTRRLMVLCM